MATVSVIDVSSDGTAECLYTENLPLKSLGNISCRRATYIEFNTGAQEWEVISADNGRVLFSHPSRQTCIEWEKENLVT